MQPVAGRCGRLARILGVPDRFQHAGQGSRTARCPRGGERVRRRMARDNSRPGGTQLKLVPLLSFSETGHILVLVSAQDAPSRKGKTDNTLSLCDGSRYSDGKPHVSSDKR